MFFAIAMISVGAPEIAEAAAPEEYRVRATIERDRGEVRGHLWARVRLAAGDDHIRLWLYADRLAETPSAMDERSWRWIYPGEVDRGRVEVSAIQIAGQAVEDVVMERAPRGELRGRDVAGADLVIAVTPSDEAREVVLEADFALRVPGRFGRLGRVDGVLAMAAPWYPLVVGEGDAWAFDEVTHTVEVRAEDGGALAIGEQRFADEGRVRTRTSYVPVIAAPALHDARVRVGATDLVLRTPQRLRAPAPSTVSGAAGIDLSRVDVLELTRAVAEETFETARAFGLTVPSRIVLAQIPSRTELVAGAPGLVLFSDRLFQIFPLDQSLDFHRRALRRALFAHLAAPLSRVDPPADRGWVTDLRAVALVDLDEARRRSGAQTPQQLLGLFAFHPAVDQLLYAPQIAFEDIYFAAIEERDPFRDDPVRARLPLSRGRRILESARDALDERALRRWVAMLVNARRSARDALRRAAPERASRLDGWLEASGAPLNYRLGETRSERLDDGYRHTVEIFRDGAARAEPVEVRVDDDRGNHEVAIWDEAGPRGEISVEMPGRLTGAHIDPRHRLPQSPAIADGHPRMDDATDLPWRPPILNGFLFNVFVTEGDFTGLVDFALRRRYDLEHTIGLRLERTRAFTGGQLRYRHGIGDKVHTNRRMGSLIAALAFDRLHEGFGGGGLGGWRPQLTAGATVNTVRYSLDPHEGLWGSAAVTGGVTFRDDSSIGWTLRGGVRGGIAIPLGLVNTLVFVAGGGFTAGDALVSELQGLGGGRRLRGFASGEMLGRGVVYGVVEHRWTAFRDLAMNIAHLVWVREIQLAFFAGGGAIFDRVVLPSGRREDAVGAVDVGLGVRIQYDYGGVQPGLISFDVGYPITRAFTAQEGDPLQNPVGFYIGFDQYF